MTINFISVVDKDFKHVKPAPVDDKYIVSVVSSFVDRNNKSTMNVLLLSRKMYSKWEHKDAYNDVYMFVMCNKNNSKFTGISKDKKIYFIDFKNLDKYREGLNIFVLGGNTMFKHFGKPDNVFLSCKSCGNILDGSTFEYLPSTYKIDYYTELEKGMRFIKYSLDINQSNEENYLSIIKEIRTNGKERIDRTGVGTYGVFGIQRRFNIVNRIPLLTTKNIPLKIIVEELLWICRGDTDANVLSNKGIKIWDGNTSAEFLKNRGLSYRPGTLGPGYGWQLRNCGFKYSEYLSSNVSPGLGFDQLSYIVNLLKTDPYSRRIFASYWSPSELNQMALVPCHVSFQFYVDNINNKKHLSCHFNMRSSDVFLGLPFNIVFYSLLTHIIALKTDMIAHEVIYTGGDVHIYKNHNESVDLQLKRQPRPSPNIVINPTVKYKDWDQISASDFRLVGYFPKPSIKAEMAV